MANYFYKGKEVSSRSDRDRDVKLSWAHTVTLKHIDINFRVTDSVAKGQEYFTFKNSSLCHFQNDIFHKIRTLFIYFQNLVTLPTVRLSVCRRVFVPLTHKKDFPMTFPFVYCLATCRYHSINLTNLKYKNRVF